MKNLICALWGLIMATFANACPQENLYNYLSANSHKKLSDIKPKSSNASALNSKSEQLINNLSGSPGSKIFSLPNINTFDTEEYSIARMDFIRVKLFSGAEISFPKNGCQMSSEAVVKFSKANSKKTIVTDFYMAIFGLSKWNGEYLEMGFDEKN